MCEPGRQGSAAGDDVVGVAAHEADDLLVDELVGQGVLGLQGRGGALLRVQGARVVDRDLGRPAEDLAFGAARLRVGGVVDLLQDARHDQEVAGSERGQVGQEVLDVGGVAHDAVAADLEDLQEAGEHVGEGQEEEETRGGACRDLGHPRVGVEAQVREVLVGQDCALGGSRRARRVHDGGDVVLGEGLGACDDAVAGRGGALGDEGVDGLGVQGEHLRVVSSFAFGCGAHDLRHGHRLGDDQVDVGVGEDVGDLVDGAGLVDGDGDEGGCPAREVQERPLVAGAAHDGDAPSGLEAAGDEAGGHGLDLVVELARRHGPPRVAHAHLAQDEGVGGAALDALLEEARDRRVLVDAHEDGRVPFQRPGGCLGRRCLLVVGRGRGVGRGHACSLEFRRERHQACEAVASLLLPAILRSRRVGEGERPSGWLPAFAVRGQSKPA